MYITSVRFPFYLVSCTRVVYHRRVSTNLRRCDTDTHRKKNWPTIDLGRTHFFALTKMERIHKFFSQGVLLIDFPGGFSFFVAFPTTMLCINVLTVSTAYFDLMFSRKYCSKYSSVLQYETKCTILDNKAKKWEGGQDIPNCTGVHNISPYFSPALILFVHVCILSNCYGSKFSFFFCSLSHHPLPLILLLHALARDS